MSKKKRARYGRDAPAPARRSEGSTGGWIELASPDAYKVLCLDGYRPLNECPEVQMCVSVYADLVSAMTVRILRNTEKGDIRVKDQLSRKLDITPAKHMTRAQLMHVITRGMLENGNQVTVPVYSGPYLDRLIPLPPREVSFRADPADIEEYRVTWRGREFRPDEVLHFPFRPDPDQPWHGRGLEFALRDIVKSLRQANATRRALQESPAPSLIVKVDGLTEEFASKQGRKRLREQYIDSSEAGEPWLIPAEAFSVDQVKPLTMSDLAIKENLELDKRSVAALFGVPPFLVGIGEYRQDEYQHFLSTRVMAIVRIIEQVLTNGLLWSEDLYVSMNPRSLYNYSLSDLINVGKEMVDRAAMRRNEWRDWMGMPPDPDMDELFLLENYLPTNRLGDQAKLNDPAEGGDENDESPAAELPDADHDSAANDP